MNWDDLKIFAVAAEAGSFSKAAEQLSTTHSTVSRRISTLEHDLDLRLFDRLSTGLTLTPGGEELYRTALAMEEHADAAERNLSGRDSELKGKVHVSIIDAMALALMPAFRRFLKAYPGISLEVTTSSLTANLSRREADVAIRIGNSPAETLVGRRVAKYHFALYAAHTLIKEIGEQASLYEYPWVTWGDKLTWPGIRKLMAKHGSKPNIVARMGGSLAMSGAVAEGIGIGYLAAVRADQDPRLKRIGPIEKGLALDVWLLTHADLRHTGRIRAFMDFIGDEIRQDFQLKTDQANPDNQ